MAGGNLPVALPSRLRALEEAAAEPSSNRAGTGSLERGPSVALEPAGLHQGRRGEFMIALTLTARTIKASAPMLRRSLGRWRTLHPPVARVTLTAVHEVGGAAVWHAIFPRWRAESGQPAW